MGQVDTQVLVVGSAYCGEVHVAEQVEFEVRYVPEEQLEHCVDSIPTQVRHDASQFYMVTTNPLIPHQPAPV